MRARLWPLVVVPFVIGCGSHEERLGTAVQADTVCPSGTTLEGVDVSHWDGSIDWSAVAGSGVSFAFLKATENTSYVDPTLDTNWAGIQQQGLVGGAYHFFHADTDPIAQADHFLQAISGLSGNVLPILDLETDNGQSEGEIAAAAIQWLDYVAMQTGKTPILYTSSAFLSDFSGFGPDTLWVANWGVNCPNVPDAWSTWVFWQYTDSGSVPGIDVDVDLNRFNGTKADLEAFAGGDGATASASSGATSSSASTGSGAGGSDGAGGASGPGSSADGSTGTGDDPGDVGSSGAGASSGDGMGLNSEEDAEPDASSGCACSSTPHPAGPGAWLALALFASTRRRRRSRST